MSPKSKKRGRPEGEPYDTLLARVPRPLADQVKAYARRHQESVSALIRDGLLWRLDEGDPHQSLYRAELAKAPLHPGLVLVLDEGDVIQDYVPVIQETQQRNHKKKGAQADPAAERMAPAEDPAVIQDTNGVVHEEPDPAPVANEPEVHPPGNAPDTPDFDHTKYMVGALCVHRHEHGTTGQSLRRVSDHECLACRRARMAASRERKRQQAPVA